MIQQIKQIAEDIYPKAVALRRQIHRNPELSFQETQTAALVAARLAELGIPHQSGIAGTGIVGLIEGARPGRTLLLRADMDALPLLEQTDVPFRSCKDGVMHACGHDAHTAALLGTAELLWRLRGELCGNVKLVFQPGEEDTGGALPMIEAGVLETPHVDACAALHVMPDVPVGSVRVKQGAFMASPDEFDITIRGKGGHGAHPEETVDPIVAAAYAITAIQALSARMTPPLAPKVISVCAIEGGAFYNVIPDEVRLKGTVRAFEDALRKRIPELLEQTVGGVVRAFGAQMDMDFRLMFPPLVNDTDMTNRLADVATAVLGRQNVLWTDTPSMAGEDFAYFAQERPSVFFHVGCGNKPDCPPIHSPLFDMDERCMYHAMQVMSAFALDYLRR